MFANGSHHVVHQSILFRLQPSLRFHAAQVWCDQHRPCVPTWCLLGRQAGLTCKVLGHPSVNGTRTMRHSVVLSHLSEKGGVIGMRPQQGQVAGLAGPALGHAPTHAGQVHSVLGHAPVGCPLPTCTNTGPLNPGCEACPVSHNSSIKRWSHVHRPCLQTVGASQQFTQQDYDTEQSYSSVGCRPAMVIMPSVSILTTWSLEALAVSAASGSVASGRIPLQADITSLRLTCTTPHHSTVY